MKLWKSALLASVGVAALGGSASAADLYKAPAPAPAPIPYSDWTGFYVGGHIGVGGEQATCGTGPGGSDNDCAGQYYYTGTMQATRDIGVLGGVNAGYDWQVDQNFVFGVAADWTWTNLKTRGYGNSGSLSWESKVNWLASFRGRAGLSINTTLFYLTGGLALGDFNDTINMGNTDAQVGYTKVLAGWVGGAGIEHKFNSHWSVFGEYLHYDFGQNSETLVAGSTTYNHDFTHVVDEGRVGLNYRW